MNHNQLALFNTLLQTKSIKDTIINKVDKHYFQFRELMENVEDTLSDSEFMNKFKKEALKYLEEMKIIA
jgi:hypothetical protein